MDYKYFGLISVTLLLVGLWYVIWKWPQGRHMTFSQHVAQHKSAVIYYFFLFGITLPLLNISFITWFVPAFGLSICINVFAVAASIFQVACTLVPEVAGWRTKCHQALAGVSALLLLPLPIILALSSNIETVGRLLAVLALFTMFGIIASVKYTKGNHPKLLIMQAAYFAAFFTPILFVSYF
jgi:hypothetical protein